MKKYLMWLAELIIWGLILFSIIFTFAFIQQKHIKDKQTYYVFFQDVDGLINGSPVKIQGYQVGYISNISLMGDEAFVTFIITDKTFEMPEKLSASVAFTGMGGSKSLELFIPPPDSKDKNFISTKETMRINDFYIYQNQIARLLVTMTGDFMKMFNKKTEEKAKEFIKNPEILDTVDDKLDDFQQSQTKLINKMEQKWTTRLQTLSL